MTKKRGIIDPWRIVEPIKPEPPKPAPQGRIDLDQIDFDKDLKARQSWVLRSKHGSIEVASKEIVTASDGLRHLVGCLFNILEQIDGPDLFEQAGIGFTLDAREWNMPAKGVPVARHATSEGTPVATLFFLNQPNDSGMLRLIRVLLTIQRRPGFEGVDILHRWGVQPMTR